MRFWEVLHTYHIDVSVEDSSGYEEGLWLVVFLLVEVEDLLNTIGAVVGSDLLVQRVLLAELGLNPL